RQLAKGDRLMLLLSQNPLQMRSLAKSLALLELGTRDLFSDIAPADLPRLAKFFIDALPDREVELVQILEAGQRLSEETREGIKAAWQAFLQDYQSH
ncbi:MAG TPA: hypothetical protein VFD14_01250, partial [Clostridia bacterium]|nr:hypothetical protein [Clostridia bacterium]